MTGTFSAAVPFFLCTSAVVSSTNVPPMPPSASPADQLLPLPEAYSLFLGPLSNAPAETVRVPPPICNTLPTGLYSAPVCDLEESITVMRMPSATLSMGSRLLRWISWPLRSRMRSAPTSVTPEVMTSGLFTSSEILMLE